MGYRSKTLTTPTVLIFALLGCQSAAAEQDHFFALFDDDTANVASAPRSQQDPALEARLDELMDGDLVPSDLSALNELLRNVDVDTPVETFVRAQGYQVLALALEQKLPAALAIANEVQSIAQKSGNSNAIAEVQIDFAEIYLANADYAQALVEAESVDALLPDVTNPRVRYHAHHLIARTLQQNGQIPKALEHLLAAQAITITSPNSTRLRLIRGNMPKGLQMRLSQRFLKPQSPVAYWTTLGPKCWPITMRAQPSC